MLMLYIYAFELNAENKEFIKYLKWTTKNS